MNADAEKSANASAAAAGQLRRTVGIPGATLLGLGSIIGTGVFVSLAMSAELTGPAVLIAILLAGSVAICNGLSSAQLAAVYPVSGGTYEYASRLLTPWLGFLAGWMFLCAKSASAATAALGFAGYLSAMVELPAGWRIPLAMLAVGGLTLLVLSGLRRSSVANGIIVSVTLGSLAVFVIACLGSDTARAGFAEGDFRLEGVGWRSLGEATALMFVAYTGYGRVATLGEEIRDPRRSIPKAVIVTLGVSMIVYLAVAGVMVTVADFDHRQETTGAETFVAPLAVIARNAAGSGVAKIVAIGAITAMLGVLLNLLLGLSRVLLAMARRGDMPRQLAGLNRSQQTPVAAVLVVAAIITGLVLIGEVRTTWSFSAFTVLVYYALTNLSALRVPPDERLYPPVFAWIGLVGCLLLAFHVEPVFLLTGLGMLAAGLVWYAVARSLGSDTPPPA